MKRIVNEKPITSAQRDMVFNEYLDRTNRRRKGKLVETSIQRLSEMTYENMNKKKIEQAQLK